MKKTKNESTVKLSTPQQLEAERQELDRMVEDRKRREDAGEIARVPSLRDHAREISSADGILSIGALMQEVLPKMEESCRKMKVHADLVRQKIASLQPEFCIDHPEQVIPVDEEATIGKSWMNNCFTVHLATCPMCMEEKRAARQAARWLDMGIPHKVQHATFDNYITGGNELKERVLKKFRHQVKKRCGFIIAIGVWGTGKSHLAAATIKEVGQGVFVTEHDLIGELRQTYSENSGQDSMVEKYRTAKALVLDEVTPDVKGVDIAPLLYRVLGYRHDNDLLTVLTSNDELEVVMQILGPKLRDRIRENYTIANFKWESHRQPKESI